MLVVDSRSDVPVKPRLMPLLVDVHTQSGHSVLAVLFTLVMMIDVAALAVSLLHHQTHFAIFGSYIESLGKPVVCPA